MVSSFSPTYCVISFSVPQDSPKAKSRARKFIKLVKRDCGGHGVVVAKGRGAGLLPCAFDRAVEILGQALPADGELRITPVTDMQVRKGRCFWGARRVAANV